MSIVILNAKIYLDRGNFAPALMTEGDRIVKIGSNEEVMAAAPAGARVIDAEGRVVIPGFNDSHMHLYYFGASMRCVNLFGLTSIEEIIERSRYFIGKRQSKPGEVIQGNGWNQDYFTGEKRMPTRDDLDKISTEYPIIFERACGHVLSCNSLALKFAGIDESAPIVEGGRADTDQNGRPIGILRENARELIKKIIPEPTVAELTADLRAALEYTASRGITSIQSMDLTDKDAAKLLEAFEELEQAGELNARVAIQCNLSDLGQFDEIQKRHSAPGAHLKAGPLKLFADGSLGSRTALMRQDYQDAPGNRGIQVMTRQQMDEIVSEADRRGLQVVIHAIGDGAVEQVLDSFEKVIEDGRNPHRHGIIHCQITDREMLRRMQQMDLLAFMQPIFLHYDLHVVESRVGKELASTSYALHSMDELGLHVSYGTDAPVELPDPFDNLHCAVNRQDLKGFPDEGFYPEERVDIFKAVDNYTVGSAYASFEEGVKGRLKEGYFADMILLDQDIFTAPAELIRQTKVTMTILGGKVVYEKSNA